MELSNSKSQRSFLTPLGQVVKARSGSNVDMNCLAAGCLRELGFTVEPVMVKLRSTGVLQNYQPELNPFDTFILRVVTSSGDIHYLDCGSSKGYLNVLDPHMRHNQAWPDTHPLPYTLL